MRFTEHGLYRDDIEGVLALPLPWDRLRGKSVLVSGATGLLGSFLVDVLMSGNESRGLDCGVYALSRSQKRAEARFSAWAGRKELHCVGHDIRLPLTGGKVPGTDFVLHLASNTHPLQYATDPVGTITTNLDGARNMMDYAVGNGAERFAFASSNEVYGENRGDAELFDEAYCGYIDCNTLRAGYPESKRCGEALCQAYRVQMGLDVVIPRFTRSYGPSLLRDDTKALSQFIRKALAGEDIVLKSAGMQYYSFTYMADAVGGLLTALLAGASGEAYNIADGKSDIRLKDLAELVAGFAGRRVVFEIPDSVEASGYSTATKARLDGGKLRGLGWNARFDIREGIRRTLTILGESEVADE